MWGGLVLVTKIPKDLAFLLVEKSPAAVMA